MAQITTTNRQAILELISQADETTEVAGLSASVTQLQVDVAGLSASVAGLTASAGTSGTSGTSGLNGTSGTSGNTGASGTSGTSGVSGTAGTSGTSVNGLNQFLSVDVPSGVATFSASASITSTVTDGTTTSQQVIIPANVVINNEEISTGSKGQLQIIYGQIYSDVLDKATNDKSSLNLIPTSTELRSENTTSGVYAVANLEHAVGITLEAYDGTNTTTETITPSTIQLNTTDGSVYTSTIDMDASSGLIQITSQDFSSSNITTETIDTTSIQSTVTDGTRTSNLHLDPNQVSSSTKFEIDDTTLQSGTGLVLNPDQSYQWGGDYNYSGITYSENYVSGQEQYLSTITDNKISQITLDPASLNTGTLFKSEDLSVGSSAILSLGYDGQSSFDMIDGVGGSSNLTFTPTTILMSATDGSTFTSTLEIDPLEAGNFTNLSTSDGTTVNKLQVSQGDATLTSSIGGITQSSVITQPTLIQLTSTDGTNTTTQNIGPTGFDTTTTDGANSVAFVADYSQFNIELYDDNVGTTANIGVDTSQSSMGANDGTGTASSIVVQPASIELTSTDGLTTNSIFIQPGITIFDGIPSYDDDAAAGTAGLTPGTLYQTTGLGANPLDVAGILMIKQ